MTDYNNGEWHGWSGGECPVHFQTKVNVTYVDGTTLILWPACRVDWHLPLLFRVTKPFVEPKKPRVMWMDDDNILHDSLEDAKNMCHFEKPTKWVEALE